MPSTGEPADALTVLVVDDHAVLGELLAGAIDAEPDLVCVGVAGDVGPALELMARERPAVVVLDAALPAGDGVDLVPRLRESRADVRVVMLTAHPRPDRARRALASGAVGYLGKDAGLGVVLAAVREAAPGAPHLDPGLAAREYSATVEWGLSPREHEVLTLLADGEHATDIARRLGLSVHTTRGYVKSVLHKTGTRSQLEAVARAVREGVVRVGPR